MNRIVSGFVLCGTLLVLSSFTSNCAVSSEDKYKTEIRDGVKYFGEGYVEYREGIPFLYLKGSSYEIGLQYGVLLREEMNNFYMRVDSFEHAMMAKVYEESPWYLDIIIRISTPFVMMNKLNSFKKRVPEDFLAQLKGMAEGSGIPLNDILGVTFGPDWLSCSSFIKEIDGRIIHGRNADHDIIDFFSRYPLVAHYERDGKYKYIDIGIIGSPFAVTGVNEHGLTVSWSQATTSSSRPFKSTGTTLMFNKILEECRNLSDVDATSKNVDRFVVMIGSLEDQAGAAYDIVDQGAVRTDVRNGYIYATNRCVSQSVRRKYNSVFDMDWGNSARAYTFEKILSSNEEFAIDDAIRLLSNIDFYEYTGKIPPREGGNINNRGTGSSVVLDPQNSVVYFASGAPYAAFSRWFMYNYETDEVSVYKNADERLRDPEFVEYVEVERRWKDVDWDNNDKLQQMIQEIENMSAENFWTLHMSCWAWNALGNPVKAEAIINRQIEKYPDFLTGYTNMGFLCVDQGKFDAAIEYYERALDAPITNDRKKLYCCEQLATAYSEISDESRVLDYYQAALDIYNRYYIPKNAREKVD
ncbi:MAG: C45 family autoproteolytic acyltransferase/hydrolase, partial [candidate division WOR-3 bacterium]|nr:C45 family autoproteolytic acyltransferase/hydrolase [candidate division WOR-3 bacterium]